mgnify:CR=1 FL=1
MLSEQAEGVRKNVEKAARSTCGIRGRQLPLRTETNSFLQKILFEIGNRKLKSEIVSNVDKASVREVYEEVRNDNSETAW